MATEPKRKEPDIPPQKPDIQPEPRPEEIPQDKNFPEKNPRLCSFRGPLHGQRASGERVRDASGDMVHEDRLRPNGIARQRAFEQRLMLAGRLVAAIVQRNHLIAKIFVEHGSVRLHQHT